MRRLDLRTTNSWTLTLEDVSTPELAEVFAINALAPFVINSKLCPVMRRGASAERPRFVVNVSAMEGKFYRNKMPTHPHTNMAKAALNMMTRTAAADLAKARVYMTAVDTGWINDEKPARRPSGVSSSPDRRAASSRRRRGWNFASRHDGTGAPTPQRRSNPQAHLAADHAKAAHFQTPIDEIDAAARILDPIFTGVAEGAAPRFGVFLKDFVETEW